MPSPVLVGLALVTMIASLYAALIYVPTDRVQGDVQRLFYLHVPAALTMYLAILLVFITSLLYLQSRNAQWDEVATAGGITFRNLQTLPLQVGLATAGYRDFDITPDGERFVMIYPADATAPGGAPLARIDVVLNWHREVITRVPLP